MLQQTSQFSGDCATDGGFLSLKKEDADKFVQDIYEELANEVILGLCFEVHRSIKLGFFFLDESKEDERKYDEVGLDVFGQMPTKKQFECICPHCQRNLAASRFAPHLEKCMGMGRNSSRIANKRIKWDCVMISSKRTDDDLASIGKLDSDIEDYDNDSDWNSGSDRKVTKKKRDKNSPRRTTKSKKNGDSSSTASSESGSGVYANYESMSFDERKAFLMQMCGVISEHTKKMCTRSHRCPQHTDEQRKSVRMLLLGDELSQPYPNNQFIDVDGLSAADSQLIPDDVSNLWTHSQVGSSSSSTDTTTSSGFLPKKKEKAPPDRGSSRLGINKKGKVKSSHNSTSSSNLSGNNPNGPSSVEVI